GIYMNEPTSLDILVAEVKGVATSEYTGLFKQIPLRLELPIFAKVDALHTLISQNQKCPRNKVLNDLITVAIDQVMAQLDEDTVFRINQIASYTYDQLSTFDSGDLDDE
ncbi:hypothetical protein, partial [Acinetobacter junii]|uniref:hypothetical protein n=3 Tax=Acinetobacter TaxID=469 RepID=UPI002804C015